jgi:transposase
MATSALHPGRNRNVHHLRGRYRLKDWRRIACRYDRCATIFLGAITLAAIVIFWLGQ